MEKKKGMYIIDHDYNILYKNEAFDEFYPDININDKCYKALCENSMPCAHCPLMKDENDKFFYNAKKKEWIKSDTVEMSYEGKEAYGIIFQKWKDKREREIPVYDCNGVKEFDEYINKNSGNAILGQGFTNDFPIFYANDEFLKLLGYESFNDAIKDSGGLFINLVHRDDISTSLYHMEHVIYPGTSFQTTYRIRRKDGTYFWALDYGKVINDINGKAVMISVINDMSDIDKLKRAVEKETKLIFDQNQMLMFMTNDQPAAYCRCEDDKDFTFIEVSSQLLNLLGYTRSELITRFDNKFRNLVLEDDINNYLSDFEDKACHKIGEVVEHTYRVRHKTKGWIWVKDVSKYGIYDDKRYIHCSIWDITNEKRAQMEIESRNKQLEIIMRIIPGGFKVTLDDDMYSFAYISPEAAALFGYTPEEFMEVNKGSSYNSIYYEDVDNALYELGPCLRGETNEFRVKYRVRCKDGSLKSIIDSGKVILDDAGNRMYYTFYLDITKAEERDKLIELQESNLNQLRLIHALSKSYSVVYSINTKTEATRLVYIDSVTKKYIDSYNRKFEGYYDRLDFYLENFIKADERADIKSKCLIENIERELLNNPEYTVNYHIHLKNMTQFYQVKYARISKDDPTEIIMGVRSIEHETNTYINEQKALSLKLESAKETARVKTDFLNSMSHDIRTPMNAITGFTNLAIKYIDDRDVALEYLNKISRSSEHLMSLINDILDMSRIEAGKIKIENKLENLGELIHNIKSMVQLDVKAKGIGLFIDNFNLIHEDVYIDRVRLSQLLLNLLSNSIKFTPAGGTIKLKIEEEYDTSRPNEGLFTLVVKDSGIGMSKEFMQTIFEPFARERTSTVSGIQGTGLGMAIAKSIVDLLGGTISVESEQGIGTEFTIKLKLQIDTSSKDPKIKCLHNRRVLIIDDNEFICKDMAKKLERLGFRCEYRTEAEESLIAAAKAIKENDPYQFILVDWIMPTMNGVALSKALRSEIGREPVIALSSTYDLSEVEIEAKNAGVDYFIAKPVFFTDIKKVVMDAYQVKKEKKQIERKRFKGQRILLAEDNAFNQEIAVQILEDADFKVEVAENGRVALDMLLEHIDNYYDLILMDIQMPILDGYQATKIIRRLPNERLASIPIVAMSANAYEENIKTSLEVGMDAHLPKPINIEMLLDTLTKLLKKK